MRVTENGYGGWSLNRGGLVKYPLILAPHDMSDENDWVATEAENALLWQ